MSTLNRKKITITDIYCYPVKSCAGFPLAEAKITNTGIQYDREWVVVDDHGKFVAQRGNKSNGIGIKSMCQIKTQIDDTHLILTAQNMETLKIPLDNTSNHGKNYVVKIWNSEGTGTDQGVAAAKWLSKFLSRELPGNYKLLRMHERSNRTADLGIAQIAFPDGFPLTIAAKSSLLDLNKKMIRKIPMNRFRPNIVIGGCKAYEEDTFLRMQIKNMEFTNKKLCPRCVMITIDQSTMFQDNEPLTTLASYRKTTEGVLFGINVNHSNLNKGIIKIGDELIIIEKTQKFKIT
ncbi:MAG: MOSC N-terminal beta barrel domain-containing protein [bacterium]